MPDTLTIYVLLFCFLIGGLVLLVDFIKEKKAYKMFFITGIIAAGIYQSLKLFNIKFQNNLTFLFLIIIAVIFGVGFVLMYKSKK